MKVESCRICGAPIEQFMSFGPMPIANAFVTPDEFAGEHRFELAPAFCAACAMLQIVEQPSPEAMFHDHYMFFTRTSRRMVAHFTDYAEWLAATWLDGGDPFVVEIGSNDGALLEVFARRGVRHLGVEPSANTAEVARGHGVETLTAFFGTAAAERIRAKYGHADAIVAANVMCHIPDLNEVARGADLLLSPRGVLVFEDPYLGDMIAKGSYDQLYDEHVFIFSAHSVSAAFGRHGFVLVDALPQETHGGSMRYVFARKGARPVSPAVADILARERTQGLDRPETFTAFRKRCERQRDDLVALLRRLKSEGRRVVGYAAASKSTTVLNYCGIGPELIEFVTDTTPEKQGRYTPGTHIPVVPAENFSAPYPDYAVLFAWNHRNEIFAKEQDFLAQGGHWVVFVPEVAVIGA